MNSSYAHYDIVINLSLILYSSENMRRPNSRSTDPSYRDIGLEDDERIIQRMDTIQ